MGFRALDQQIDTTTASGACRSTCSLRWPSSSASSGASVRTPACRPPRARGRRGGRPRALSGDQVAVVRAKYDSREHTVTAIAGVLGVSRATIYRELGTAADVVAAAQSS